MFSDSLVYRIVPNRRASTVTGPLQNGHVWSDTVRGLLARRFSLRLCGLILFDARAAQAAQAAAESDGLFFFGTTLTF